MAIVAGVLIVIVGLAVLLAWVGNFYLAAQYVLYPRRRSRFSRGSGVWGGGWFLWVIGIVLAQSASQGHSWAMSDLGELFILVGAACMIYTARRHWQERAQEKRAAQSAPLVQTNDAGT